MSRVSSNASLEADMTVDSLLAKQGNITGVSEILNGCL